MGIMAFPENRETRSVCRSASPRPMAAAAITLRERVFRHGAE